MHNRIKACDWAQDERNILVRGRAYALARLKQANMEKVILDSIFKSNIFFSFLAVHYSSPW